MKPHRRFFAHLFSIVLSAAEWSWGWKANSSMKAVVITISALLGSLGLTFAEEPVALPENAVREPDHNGIGYQPFEVAGARLIPRVQHLQPERDWERMDVYVPDSAQPGQQLPCIVNVFGGGYSQKGVATMKPVVRPLIDRGYVVACPDYALQVHAPEALASWDVAAAIRHLRANAADYQIDPERIGICGWSAGGWVAQFIGYSGPADFRTFELPTEKHKGDPGATPAVEPRPANANHPFTVQAVVSDWGAGKLLQGKGEQAKPHVSLSPDDPPLLTCYDGKPREMPQSSVAFLQALGIPAEPVFLGDVRSTHVPKFDTHGWNAEGEPTTWEGAIYDFFDRTVKAPPRCSAPQITLVPGERKVELLCVHAIYGDGAVRFTLDGSEPTPQSPRYETPVELQPGQTIKAISVKPELPASAIASYTAPQIQRPDIAKQTAFEAKVGEPFRVEFAQQLPKEVEVTWAITGRVGEKYRLGKGRPQTVPWLKIDRQTGVLSGVPRVAGVYPVIVSTFVSAGKSPKLNRETTATDARLIVITVQP